jgi:FkbM family methyltransferase
MLRLFKNRYELFKVIGYKLSTLYLIPNLIKSLGLVNAIKYSLLRLLRGLLYEKFEISISLPLILYPMIIRTGTSDLRVFDSILIEKDYDFQTDIKPKLIIDGGAYVGYSSIYFANKFPEAKIFSIEPEINNFKILKENTFNYKKIELINSALWNRNIFLRIKDVGRGEYGFVVEESNTNERGSFKAITIGEILKESKYDKIDILKLDIEGAEKEIFSCNYDGWLSKVNILIIELHDRFKPGCSEAFYSALSNYNFNIIRKRNDIAIAFHDI